MKMTKTLGFCAVALAALAGLAPRVAWAAAAEGDIRSIESYVDETDPGLHTFPNAEDPAGKGERVRFCIRLANRDWAKTYSEESYINTWGLRHIGTNPAVVDTNYMPQVGLWISGKLQFATIEKVVQKDLHYTDMVCCYTVKAGDFALPIRLANSTGTGPAMGAGSEGYDSRPQSNYYLRYSNAADDRWAYFPYQRPDSECTASSTNRLNFWFGPTLSPAEYPGYVPSEDGSEEGRSNFDLSLAGIYVKAIDFDDTYATEDKTIWRNVAQGATTVTPALPTLAIPGGSPEAIKLYVWAADPTVAEMEGGTPYKFGDGATRKVATIAIKPDDTSVAFSIRGLGDVGKTTEIFLADTPTNIFNLAGTLLTNFTYRTIKIVEPPPPSVTVTLTASEVTATTNHAQSVSAIDIELSETYSEDVTVTLEPVCNADSAKDPFDYIGLSTSAYGKDHAKDKTLTLTVKADQKKASLAGNMLYVFANRGNDVTAKGIKLAIKSVEPAAAAAYFKEEYRTGATLMVNPCTPVLVVPSMSQSVVWEGGVETELTLVVADAYAELDGTYTLKLDQDEDGQFEKEFTGLTPDAKGQISVKFLYTSGGEKLPRFKVINQDGEESAPTASRDVVITVKSPKTVQAQYKKQSYCEGDTLDVAFKFSEAFTTGSGEPGYLFLVPRDADSTNLVECDAFEYGVPIYSGDDPDTILDYAITQLTFKDGKKSFSVKYDIVVRDSDDPEGTILSAWGGKTFEIAVTNSVPYVYSVMMNGNEVEVNGADKITMPVKANVGIDATYTITALDASDEVDLPDLNFVTEVKFFENGQLAAGGTKTLYGDPSTQPISFAFTTAGSNYLEIRVYDKDMTTTEKSKAKKVRVAVETTDAPGITIKSQDSSTIFWESESGPAGAKFDVTLSVPPTGLTNKQRVRVKLTATQISPDGATMTLSSDTLEYANNQDTQTFYFEELDGTPMSASKGWTIAAEVTDASDGTAPDGRKWSEYYEPLAANQYRVYVKNEDPVIGPGLATTNETPASINVPVTIKYTISDIDIDEAKIALIQWTCSGQDVPDQTDVDVRGQKLTQSFTFDSAGHKEVYLHVEDKDGGSDDRTYYFYVDPSKNILLFPHAPEMNPQTAFTQKFTEANGLGYGRVWADGALSTVKNFVHTWNVSPTLASASIFAHGYRVGDTDAAWAGPSVDYVLDASGNYSKSGTAEPYVYPDAELDSFFYCWIMVTGDAESGFTGAHAGGVINPEKLATDTGSIRAALPEYDEETVSYADTIYEAIFAKEYLAKDNLGDINQDGVPDLYAVRTWRGSAAPIYEQAGAALESAGDLTDLTAYNGDTATDGTGDYMPARTSIGEALVPNLASTWATEGSPFTAPYEIRGFGEGLNHRAENDGLNLFVKGAWISEPDYTFAEALAFCQATGTEPPASEGDLEQWLTDNADAIKASDWSPENRTDPTIEDTDGDGFPDGYEYYFWYMAHVGEVQDGKLKQLTGSKFRLSNIAQGEVMPATEIEELFNPTKSAGASNLMQERDADNDGLYDLEEFLLGTNPIHWDTDGDGMNDMWEVMRGLNPLEKDADANADGDFMAIYTTEKTYAIVEIPDLGLFALPNNGAGVVADDGTLLATESFTGIPVYRYGADDSVCTPTNRGVLAEDSKTEFTVKPLDPVEILIPQPEEEEEAEEEPEEEEGGEEEGGEIAEEEEEEPEPIMCTVKKDQPVQIVHDQVYAQFGFDPRTGWNALDTGYVAARWDSTGDGSARYAGEAGKQQNTAKFTALHEYLLLKYRYMTMPAIEKDSDVDGDTTYSFKRDTDNIAAKKTTLAEVFKRGTTNPNAPFSTTYGSSETEYACEDYGADTDNDGVPDGWELYVRHNPNSTKHQDGDDDSDLLTYVKEYAGTDSCNAYAGVPTVITNHPGEVSGWYNKFFPTDPWNKDTDGDGLKDGAEGAVWVGSYHFGQATQGGNEDTAGMSFSFIYGSRDGKPAADDGRICVRGGGLNPCAVDTDGDLLPDPFEHDFAGVRYTPEGQPFDGAGLSESTIKLHRRNDGLADGAAAVGYYISGGLDGTWGWQAEKVGCYGDAFTSLGYKDPATGTTRNYDIDSDGLQNYQEYLVQSLRHLRYDDAETPLMGSWMPGGSPASRTFKGFLEMNILDGETYYAAAKKKGFAATGAWKFADLGYFARPAHAWDPAALNTYTYKCMEYDEQGYRVMLRPTVNAGGSATSASSYCSTDPRCWDSDQDGMDDFYELFHGMNPLLGDTSDPLLVSGDVVAKAYDCQVAWWYNAWTGWPMSPSGAGMYSASGELIWDMMQWPWLSGSPDCDADGDGLRNYDEALMVNITSPQPTHTDPTPLWFTDASSLSKASFTAQYYKMVDDFQYYPWGIGTGSAQTTDGANYNFIFSFEENEGYDTDHDGICDAEEKTLTATPLSDPLNFADPDRRQAVWFPGEKSAVVSYNGTFQRNLAGAYDLLRQFTVEGWIRPEDVTKDQVILERAVSYGSATLSNAFSQIRANFRLGIRGSDGCVYGVYDTDDAVTTEADAGAAYVKGGTLAPNVWTHVALSFDGTELRLYVNGQVVNATPTTKIPATGIVVAGQDAVPNNAAFPVLINGYTAKPSVFALGARVVDASVTELSDTTTWKAFDSHYAGYIDEVRVWDGARTPAQIRADYQKRYSFSDVSTLRDEIYAAWAKSATRNDNDGRDTLPAELVFHYNFQTLPGAVNATDVQWEPSGFTAKVVDNVRVDENPVPGDLWCGWWKQTPVHSTVYKNYRLVPWIPNTCAHLPNLDGSAADSAYWSALAGGVCLASEMNETNILSEIVFPNTANPYPYYNFGADRAYHLKRLAALADLSDAAAETYQKYQFDLRTGFSGSTDLIPLGGAFAKRCEQMWDGEGAADAWTLTADGDSQFSDLDGNGLPDWWQDYAAAHYGVAAEGLTWNTKVTRNGVEMTVREAYVRDLAEGMQPDGSVNAAYASTVDDDDNGIPDWWEKMYNLVGAEAYADADGDGLSNWAEYQAYVDARAAGIDLILNPTVMATDGYTLDYFRRTTVQDGDGNTFEAYLGAVYSDHDFMEDTIEVAYDVDFINRAFYDALGDKDEDGWSNWAEVRAGTDPTRISTPGVDDGLELTDYPIPQIKAFFTYRDQKSISTENNVVMYAYKAGSDYSQPEAVWGTVDVSDAQETAATEDSDSDAESEDDDDSESATTTSVTPSLYLGGWQDVKISRTLGGVQPGSVYILAKDNSSGYEGWVQCIQDVQKITDPEHGVLRTLPAFTGSSWQSLINGSSGIDTDDAEVGTIDYVTGKIEIDFSKLTEKRVVFWTDDNSDSWYFNLRTAYYGINYRSTVRVSQMPGTFYLGPARSGRLTEGKHTFMAFIDQDGDGLYTTGEPVGFARDVNVGWDTVADIDISISDDSDVFPRFAVSTSNKTDVVRILRTAINGQAVSPRCVFSRRITQGLTAITEVDLLKDGDVDFDGDTLAADAQAYAGLDLADVLSVTYQVYVGFGAAEPVYTYTKTFEKTIVKPVPSGLYEMSYERLLAAQPTFTWKGAEGFTGFALEVAEDEAFTRTVYAVTNLLPAVREDSYRYTPEIYVGNQLKDGTRYYWRVAELNAKFRTPEWSSVATFETCVNTQTTPTSYGRLALDVRYYGPCAAPLENVVVGVYETADFATRPIAVKRLAGAGTARALTNAFTEAFMAVRENAASSVLFDGIHSGDWYVMAYIDANTNGVRDAYEPWGYVNGIGTESDTPYAPISLNVPTNPIKTKYEKAILVMEDTDVNQDGILDVLQPAMMASWALSVETPAYEDDLAADDDQDGLTNGEEYEIGTNPTVADTDGDGIPDGAEVDLGSNPLAPDRDAAGKGDVMALAEVEAKILVATNGTDEASYAVLEMKDETSGQVTNSVLYTLFANPFDAEKVRYAGRALTAAEKAAVVKNYAYGFSTNVVLLHSAVYDWYGFDATTARADGGSNAVNTVAFSAYYKYLTQKYYLAEVDASNAAGFALAIDKFDSNGNYLPDGWELYIRYVNPVYVDGQAFDLAEARSAYGDNVGGLVYDPYGTLVRDEDGTPIANADAIAYRLFDFTSESGVYELDMESDYDMDGVPNYYEYRISVVDAKLGLLVDDPISDDETPDYFRFIASGTYAGQYVGEVFNGGEWIEDEWRTLLGGETPAYLGTRSYKTSGWDYWSIARNSGNSAAASVSDTDLAFVLDYLNIVVPGECSAKTLPELREFVHQKWAGVEREVRQGDYWNDSYNYSYTYDEATGTYVYTSSYGEDEDESVTWMTLVGDKLVTIEEMIQFFGGRSMMELTIEKNAKDVSDEDLVLPAPVINLTLKYTGDSKSVLLVDVYQVDSAYPERGEQRVAFWNTTADFASGVVSLTLETPNAGALMQGPARFVAYIDGNGDGKLSDGDTYGEAKLNVGYLGGAIEITLGAPNAALPVIALEDGTNAVQAVAIVRTALNGQSLAKPQGVWVKVFGNDVARTRLYPSDFVSDDFVGVDRTLAALDGEVDGQPLVSATYAVLTGFGPFDAESVEANAVSTFTLNYSVTRDKAVMRPVADGLATNATVSFEVPESALDNARYWLKVDGVVYGGKAGYPLVNGADGVYTVKLAGLGLALAAGEHTFAVALGNDKFGYPADSDFCAAMTQSIGADAAFDGGFAVTVKHPKGSFDLAETGCLVLAAYEKADLAEPVRVWKGAALNTAFVASGLRPGVPYFLAAWYVKNAADGRDASLAYRKPYDTWGYLSALTNRASYCFTPSTVKAGQADAPTAVTIYLQDTDWNDNDVIDRLEDFAADAGEAEVVPTTFYDDFDGDGLPSAFDPDPVFPEEEEYPDSDAAKARAARGDVMAYYDTNVCFVAVGTNAADVTWYALWDLAAEPTKLVDSDIPLQTPAAALETAYTVWDYGTKGAAALWGLGRKQTFTDNTLKVWATSNGVVRLVHAQVYALLGYDAYTANPTAYADGVAVNTKPFTALDKFLVVRYLAAIGVAGVDEDALMSDPDNALWNLYWNDTQGLNPADADNDDVADGWELYTMFGSRDLAQVANVTLDAAKVSPLGNGADGQALTSVGGLTLAEEYDGGFWPTDPWQTDSDGDGISDADAYEYCLKGDDAYNDRDLDGLANGVEYLIKSKFDSVFAENLALKATEARSLAAAGQLVPDYFLKVGKLYLGEMFTDHDFMDDTWEDQYDATQISRGTYDAQNDPDDDGWSNFAEARANTDPTKVVSNVDSTDIAAYPVPLVKTTVSYHGNDTLQYPVIIKAWSQAHDVGGMPDAVWTVGAASSTSSSSSSSSTSSTSSTSSSDEATTTAGTAKEKLFGQNAKTVLSFHLSPGNVEPGSVVISFKDRNFKMVERTVTNGKLTKVEWVTDSTAEPEWVTCGLDVFGNGETGTLKTNGQGLPGTQETIETCGTINYTTGEVTLDLTKFGYVKYSVVEAAASGSTVSGETETNATATATYRLTNLNNAYVKVAWTSRGNTSGSSASTATYYLSDADQPTAEQPSLGRVREGKNLFTAFLDVDGDGAWTPGEPYGVCADVDVGWSATAVDIELSDTSSAMARMDLASALVNAGESGFTDRETKNATEGYGANQRCPYADMSTNVTTQAALTQVSVYICWLNGKFVYDELGDAVFQTTLDLAKHPELTEADLWAAGLPEMGWKKLQTAWSTVNKKGWASEDSATIKSVSFMVKLGDTDRPDNNLKTMFQNTYETTTSQSATTPDPNLAQLVYAGSPTFRWKHENTIGKRYPAFKARIYNADGKVVYESPVLPAPVRDAEGYYSWTAPVYCGMMTSRGYVFETTNNYTWAVSMLDAKFTSFRTDEAKTPFRLTCTGNADDEAGYGSIPVAVKYFGPLAGSVSTTAATLRNLIHVEAFTTPDFSGTPAGAAYVTDATTLDSPSNLTVNAVIRGVPAGTYYVRAYLDTDADFEKDASESWGYGSNVGETLASGMLYTPKGYTVGRGLAVPQATVYIEDVDTDYDGMPDSWETAQNDALTAQSTISGNTFFAKVNPTLAASLDAYDLAGFGTLAESPLRMALGASASGASTAKLLMAASAESYEEQVAVSIRSFSLEEGIVLDVSAAAQASGALVVADRATVSVYVSAATQPDFSDATSLKVKDLVISANDTTNATVTPAEIQKVLDEANLGSAGFFKVRIEAQ